MKLIINIYRVYDADLYALNMTVGRKMFGELLVAALKGYAAGAKPGITFGEISIPNQAEGVNKRVIHIQKTIKDGTPEADMLMSIQPRLTGLFVKNLLRWYYFRSFQPFYFNGEAEVDVPQPVIKVRPPAPVKKEKKQEEKVEKIEAPKPVKSVSKAVEETKVAAAPIENVKPEVPVQAPKQEPVKEVVEETSKPIVEEESDNSGIEDLMSLFAGINVN